MQPVSLATCLLGMLGTAFATPITYAVRFHVTGVSEQWNGGNPTDQAELYDYKPAIGDVFVGSLRLDGSVGAIDGDDRMGGLLSLDLNLAGLAWTYDIATGYSGALAGFRSIHGLGSVSPSFAFESGELTGWRGGVYGGADYPFIDFLGRDFASADAGGAFLHGKTSFEKYELIPEPSTLVYFLIPIIGWFLRRKARPQLPPS